MKEIRLGNGRTITSPWLRREEASLYCGISQSMFDSHSINLPHGGTARNRLYHVHVLDKFMNNEIPDCPFDMPKKLGKRPRKVVLDKNQDMTLINPKNGKAFEIKED